MVDFVKITVDENSQSAFYNALRNIARLTNVSVYRLLRTLAIYSFQSARKLTPQSKTKRPVRRATKEEKKKFEGKPLVMEWYEKDGTIHWTPIESREDGLRIIKKRGAAKNSWSALIGKLGGPASIETRFARVARQATMLIKESEGDKPFIVALNKMRYINKHVPEIESQAIVSAQNRLLGAQLAKLGDNAQRIWGS